jgi:xylulokinase
MNVIGGLDVGTTGCKIALYDEKAQILETYYTEYDAVRQRGEHEIDFGVIREKVMGVLKKATEKYEMTALGVTSFGETFVMLDDNDTILAPSILYTDPRGTEECSVLGGAMGEDRLTLLTGVKPHCMYSIYKMMWHKRNTPILFEKCKKILLCEDFIIYCLTGVRQISYSLAARTGAFDIEKKCWIKEMFDTAGIDIDLMSTPVREGSVCGRINETVKHELGIDYDVAVVSAGHDQIANMVGSGIFEKTQAMDGTGTVECIPVILPQKPTDLAFYQGGYAVVPFLNGEYACYAFSFTGGATLKWFRDNFAEAEYKKAVAEKKNVYALLDEGVKEAPTEILVLPHFAGAATPYMDNDAKAAFVGITLETDKSDLYKALMEGTSYEMRLNFSILKKYVGEIKEIRTTGGGASSDVWLQIKADILQNEIIALHCKEVGAAGAAALAGHAVGVYKTVKEATETMAPVRKVFSPKEDNSLEYTECYQKYANLYQAIKNL